MSIACLNMSAGLALQILTCVAALLGAFYTYRSVHTTRQIALLEKRMEIYLLFQSLVVTLEQTMNGFKTKTDAEMADFAGEWLEQIKQQIPIRNLFENDSSSILLANIEERVSPYFNAVPFVFSKKSISGEIDPILQQFANFRDAHADVCVQSKPFSCEVSSSVRDALSHGHQALSDMEKAMKV